MPQAIPPHLALTPNTVAGRVISIPIAGGRDVEAFIPDQARSSVRRQFIRDARTAQARAAIAANQATLAYTLGGTLGGALATSGIVAIATGSGPIGIAGLAITGIGALLSSVGIFVAHRISNLRVAYDENANLLRDLAEDLR